MYANRDFSPVDSPESVPFSFDFAKHMDEGETIIAATWFCTVAVDSQGDDPDAADHVSIPADFSGTVTTQHVSGFVNGVKYALQAVVETSGGKTLSLWSHTECRDPR